MRAFTVIRNTELTREILSLSRIQFSVPGKPFFFRAKSGDSGIDGLSCSTLSVPSTSLAAEKEEAKAVLTLFLKKKGFSNAVAAETINKSDPFIEHLVLRLHTVYESRSLTGGKLSTLEISDALVPYLESLLKENGEKLADLVESFTIPLSKVKAVAPVCSPHSTLDPKKLKAVSRVSETSPAGQLPPHILYLIEVGLDLEQIKLMAHRFPSFAYYSLEMKIKPVIEFLLDLGVSKSDIPSILTRRPQLCGYCLPKTVKPTMRFLENLGVDKKQWAKIICYSPGILTHSKQKVEAVVNFLSEIGISAESIGKIITRCPQIMTYSVEDNLRPTAEYFHSLGISVGLLLHQFPKVVSFSVEAHLKPVTEFFLERGFHVEEFGIMILKFGHLYGLSLEENLIPKWEYFLTMDYPKEDLVKFPQYFGYSFEGRIKQRYELVKECGVKFRLNHMLTISNTNFEKVLKLKMEKVLSDKASSDSNNRISSSRR